MSAPLSPEEYETVERFGLDREEGLAHTARMRGGFVVVVLALGLLVAAMVLSVVLS